MVNELFRPQFKSDLFFLGFGSHGGQSAWSSVKNSVWAPTDPFGHFIGNPFENRAIPRGAFKHESRQRLRYPLANSIPTVLHVCRRHGDYLVRFPRNGDACRSRKALKLIVTVQTAVAFKRSRYVSAPHLEVLLFTLQIQVTFERRKIRFEVTFFGVALETPRQGFLLWCVL